MRMITKADSDKAIDSTELTNRDGNLCFRSHLSVKRLRKKDPFH